MKQLKFIDIDFETRSLANIRDVGANAYARHESTEIMIIAWSFNQGKTVDSYNPFFDPIDKLETFLRRLRIAIRQGWKIRAFNSMFEYLIWNSAGIKQFNFPLLDISHFYCVMAEACAMGFPASLENAANVCSNIPKNKEGTTLINFFSKPVSKKNLTFRKPEDHKDRFMKFVEYCEDDVRAQIGVSNSCNKLTPSQYRIFLLTEQMNIRGLPIDLKMLDGALALSEVAKEESCKQILKVTDNKVSSPTQNKALQEWLIETGCLIPNLQAATVEKWLKKPNLKRKHKIALELRAGGSKSSIAKYVKAKNFLANDGKVHDSLKYHIASTGRWGGRGIQIQNFPKPSKDFPKWFDSNVLCEAIADQDRQLIDVIYGSVSEALKAAARGLICAPKDMKFVSADYSQIEARIVMWLAGDPKGMADFAGDGLIYEKMAAVIFEISYRKIAKPSFERDVGKETVLGSGFGMGWKKFLSTCNESRGLSVDPVTAKKAINEYRKRYEAVPAAWKDCAKQAMKAIKNPGQIYSVCNGKVLYSFDGQHLYCHLPSTRKLTYPYASVGVKDGEWGPQESVFYYTWDTLAHVGKNWKQTDIWGGILFQHAVQATAADIMANGMLTAEEKGYPSIFTVHDEAVSLIPEDSTRNFKEYEKILCQLPKWAKGLPVVAEGWEGKRYRK